MRIESRYLEFAVTLAARVRKALGKRADVVEKPMFGGLTFMVAGKMCCGVIEDELMVRLSRGDPRRT